LAAPNVHATRDAQPIAADAIGAAPAAAFGTVRITWHQMFGYDSLLLANGGSSQRSQATEGIKLEQVPLGELLRVVTRVTRFSLGIQPKEPIPDLIVHLVQGQTSAKGIFFRQTGNQRISPLGEGNNPVRSTGKH
jgi:hypothetical protein